MARDDGGRVHHGAARIDLHLPGIDSLKGKRALVKATLARLENDLGCAVAEIGFQDRWQRAAIGVGTVSGTATGVDRVLDRVTAVVERDPRVEVIAVATEVDVLDADPPL
ncbi:DUF503 domain-containing protein [Nitriliruptor alkaliphilus]|uniref:DUF503 domain-containing protein n=1 Tax=Nitriliruptor alkaliphilus TaxID=427918 RepID=UPI000698EA15|nr:DUF503 domain-containing protein [Nitriliruptor alkaliphilus]